MSGIVQLLVSRRSLDPVAWTALHALRELELPATPRALGRADLWEFALPPECGVEELIRWAVSANWFANPSRDLVRWRRHSGDPTALSQAAVRADGGVGDRGDGAYLAVTWIDALRAPAHEKAVRRHLGAEIAVYRGHVWWLGVEGKSAAGCLAAATGAGEGGLLLNPHSQRSLIYPDDLPVPTLFADVWGATPREKAGGML
jgi:hypothetical protein